MITTPLTFILLILAMWMLYRGLFALKTFSFKRNREEAEKIFRQRVIAGEEKAIVDLLSYFKKIKISIWTSVGYFLLAYGLVFTSLFTIKNSDTPSPLWQLALFVLALSLIPIAVIATASFDLKTLKNDILSRFRPTD